MSTLRLCLCGATAALLAITRLASADDADTVEPTQLPPAEASTKEGWTSKLPLMADEARARGYDLPLPFGGALVLTYLGTRKIEVHDVRLSIEGNPGQSVNQFLNLGSDSTVFNANLKFDAWILPFLNLYALVGYVHNNSSTHAHVTLPGPGPLPDQEFDTTIDTELDGVVGGAGMTLAAGYKEFFLVADASYIRSDLGFDDKFTALIATVRTGWNGNLGGTPTQLWLGVGNWDTAATAKGHADLGNGQTLVFEADQAPATPWMYDVGTQVQFSKAWQLVADVGFDFDGGYVLVLCPTYRF